MLDQEAAFTWWSKSQRLEDHHQEAVRTLSVPTKALEAGSAPRDTDMGGEGMQDAPPSCGGRRCCWMVCPTCACCSCRSLWYCHNRCCHWDRYQLCTRTVFSGRLYMTRDGSKVGIRTRCAPALGWLLIQASLIAYSLGHIFIARFLWKNPVAATLPLVGLPIVLLATAVQFLEADARNDTDWRYQHSAQMHKLLLARQISLRLSSSRRLRIAIMVGPKVK